MVTKALQQFRAYDTPYLSRSASLTYRGINGDTVGVSFSPDSASDMIKIMELIKTRDREGGDFVHKQKISL